MNRITDPDSPLGIFLDFFAEGGEAERIRQEQTAKTVDKTVTDYENRNGVREDNTKTVE